MRRLTAEELRDAMLCLTGSLNPAQHRPERLSLKSPSEVLERPVPARQGLAHFAA